MTLRQTPLYARQVDAGGKFIDFGDWTLPVHYGPGINAEHAQVRERAGLFDVSHMGEIDVRGPNALAAVDGLITNDLSAVADGQACYTALCNPQGGIIDDLVVYRFGPERVFICCNASNRAKDFDWIHAHIDQVSGAEAVDVGDTFAQLAIQGPAAVAALQKHTPAELSDIGRYWFTEGQVAGVPAIISRTGYTGEDGFELYLPADRAGPVWDALIADDAVEPIGLGARDTLRLEMKYALYGNDIDETTTPLEAGLGWITKLDAGPFVGRDALIAQKAAGIPRRLVAFTLDKGIPRHDYPVVDADGRTIGVVTSGTRSPTLGRSIGMAYVPSGQHKVGTPIAVQIRTRVHTGTLVKPPFVSR